MERKNAWKSCDEAKLSQVNALCADYINSSPTARQSVSA